MQISNNDVFSSKMDAKGRVTVPKGIRDQWSVEGGDRVEVAIVGAQSNGYECSECGEEHDLAEVAIFNRGEDDEWTACTECLISGRINSV